MNMDKLIDKLSETQEEYDQGVNQLDCLNQDATYLEEEIMRLKIQINKQGD